MKKILICLATIAIISLPLVACSDKSDALTTYTINATLDAEQKIVTAQMSVDYVNDTQSELEELAFHLYGNAYREGGGLIAQTEISSAYPSGLSYGYMKVSEVTDESGNALEYSVDDNDVLSVTVPTLMPTQRTTVNMQFELKLAEIRHRLGYYSGKYNLGNWYPILCSFKNGQWNKHPYYSNGDPFDSVVANYDVTLTYPSSLVAASTGGEGTNGELKTQIKSVRDFAVCIGDYNVYRTETDGVKINWYTEGSDDYSGVAALAVQTYSELFGKYALDELAVVKTAFINGGMEYPGLVYVSDALNDEMTKEVIAHETAHQWWYSAVGNDQVNEAWLDEGLTEYSTTLFYEHNQDFGVKKEDRIADSLTTYTLYCELYKTNGEATAMNKCVGDYASNMDYTYMTYVKGQLLFDCLRTLIGDDAFFKGLRYYYATYLGNVASQAELVGAFEKYTSYQLSGYVNSWVDGSARLYSVN